MASQGTIETKQNANETADFEQESIDCEEKVAEIALDGLMDVELPIVVTNVKKDLYEKSDGTLTINLYIKNATKSTARADVNGRELNVTFQTSDPNMLSCHPNSNRDSFFIWAVTLKEAVVPNDYVLRTTPSTILITLKKVDPGKKWDSIEATVQSYSNVNRVVPNMWVPVMVPATTQLTVPLVEPCRTPEKPTDSNKQASPTSRDEQKSPIVKKPTCMVNPLDKDHDNAHVVAPGMTGLANLGNTCFMNSVLQCLVNTGEFRDYFLESSCLLDINIDNPLGSGGKLAKKFANLCSALWDGRHHVFEPSQLKNFIAMKASQFSGHAQHDAHEFMAFLLDGLHEDLNRIVSRPYIEVKDWDGRADEVMASEAWDMYRKRNDSIVVDLFQGQYKSKLLCPVCSKVSITFDPFLYLAVPLPKKIRYMPVFFFSKDPSHPPVKFHVKLTQDSTVEDIKEQIHQTFKVLPVNLRVFEVYKNRVHRFLVKGVETISPTDTIFVFEVLSQLSVGEPVCEITVVQRVIIPLRSTRCSFCSKDSSYGDNSLKRCTKCLKASYCDQFCQKNHWNTHKANCKYSQELLGFPFIVSLPQSKITLAKLSQVMEAYARYSVDVFQPPAQLPDGLVAQNSSNTHREKSSVPESEISVSQDFLPTNVNVPQACSMEDVPAQGTASIITEMSPEKPTSVSSDVGPKVQVVYGRQRSESGTERPIPMFAIRHVNQHGVSLPGAEGKVLEDQGDCPLQLSSEAFLAMDWRNNDKQENYVLVQSKLLIQAEFSEHDTRRENNFTLDQCLKLFTEPEILSSQEAWYCPKCKQHREATKEMSIWKLPTVLIVQLKRFSFQNLLLRDKIDKMVEYPTRGLDMSDYYCGPTIGEPPAIYDLYATINHHGGIFGGHYTAYARLLDKGLENRSEIDWRVFDDTEVRTTSESLAVTRSAYVLFYRRRGVIFNSHRPSAIPGNQDTANPSNVGTSSTIKLLPSDFNDDDLFKSPDKANQMNSGTDNLRAC